MAILAVVMVLALLGCGAATPSPLPATPTVQVVPATATPTALPPTATATPTQTPVPPTRTPTATPFASFDCGLAPIVTAWIDLDGDGSRDLPDEPPLAGVTFVVELPEFSTFTWKRTTDDNGRGQFYIFPIPCGFRSYFIYAEVPTGYRATTPVRIELVDFGTFAVGFVKEP
ncbi:MAG: hypothetical protein U0841_12970 [Chloroflexia bacterium]